jgi:hypothetical protein
LYENIASAEFKLSFDAELEKWKKNIDPSTDVYGRVA